MPVGPPRVAACGHACELSVEHAHAVRTLFGTNTPNSACAMLRTQYEALLRGAWAMYAATDAQVEKLLQPLGPESEQAAKNLPGAAEMLSRLERQMDAAPGLVGVVVPLRQIYDASWRAMNSFVHGGIHPMNRAESGFPDPLATQILRNSNGIMHLSFRLLARLGPSADIARAVDQAYLDFQDCLPMA